MIFDYRLQHRGGMNTTPEDRLVLYLCYCKPWFRDHNNHRARKSLFGKPPQSARILKADASEELCEGSGEKCVLFQMQIELGPGIIETIQVCHGDVPSELAATVVKRHSLPEATSDVLTQAIQAQLDALGEAVRSESPSAKRQKT